MMYEIGIPRDVIGAIVGHGSDDGGRGSRTLIRHYLKSDLISAQDARARKVGRAPSRTLSPAPSGGQCRAIYHRRVTDLDRLVTSIVCAGEIFLHILLWRARDGYSFFRANQLILLCTRVTGSYLVTALPAAVGAIFNFS